MTSGTLGVVAVGLLRALTSQVEAQQLRGVVRDSATTVPVPGAVATLADPGGRIVARTLSGADGRFLLPLVSGAAALRVIHIGFQPREQVLTSLGRDTSVQLSLARLPAILNSVHVSEPELCPASADRGMAFRLWSEARAGLQAAAVAKEMNVGRITAVTFRRAMDPRDDAIHQQQKQGKTGAMNRPFEAAAPASSFAQSGYMREDASGRTFFAPDGDVLLDPSFAGSHCFHVSAPDAAHAGEIGLVFTPLNRRDTLVDVSGTIWMDVAKSELRSLEFRYTGLEPAAIDARSGGHIEFHTMPNGVAVITSWSIRLPVMTPMVVDRAGLRSHEPLARRDRRDLHVTEILESGGEVVSATWQDATVWLAQKALVEGTVRERGSRRAVGNAVVHLIGTADSATTDANGHFQIDPGVPGRYVVAAADTSFAAFVPPRAVSTSTVIGRGTVMRIDLELPSVTAALAEACKAQQGDSHTTVLVGQVTLSRGTSSHGKVRAEWLADVNHGSPVAITTVAGGSSSSQASATAAIQSVDLDERGRFTMCGVATERPIRLHLTQGGAFADTIVFARDSLIKSVAWHPAPHFVTAGVGSASFSGTVFRDVSGAPMAGADVWLPGLDRRTETDRSGAFRFDGLPPGRQIVQIRHLGFERVRDTLTVSADGSITRRYSLASTGTVLDTVRTVAVGERFLSPQLRGFERRRVAGAGGQFVSDSTLRANESSPLSTILRGRVAGITWVAGQYAVSVSKACRGAQLLHSCSSPDCYVAVYMDGTALYTSGAGATGGPPPDLSRINASELSGVEFYASAASAPAGMTVNDDGCGSLWLWTRER